MSVSEIYPSPSLYAFAFVAFAILFFVPVAVLVLRKHFPRRSRVQRGLWIVTASIASLFALADSVLIVAWVARGW
jgi:hypothetical protein